MDYYNYMNYKLDGKYISKEKLPNHLLECSNDFFYYKMSETFYYLVNYIDQGLKNDKFLLYFQPQYDLQKEKLIGFEALSRLKDNRGNIISPKKFIPVAECTDQIFELEQWVFKAGLGYKKMLEEQGYGEYYLSLNLSAKSLIHDTFFHQLVEIIESFNINYEYLNIEITETDIVFDSKKACDNLKVLKKLGINIALDDFGTGFSSLLHLEELPIDIVKLDRHMIKKIPNSIKTCTIIKRIIELSHELGLIVVAEGIEDYSQLEYLIDINCDLVQGYLFAKPMPSEELLLLIK